MPRQEIAGRYRMMDHQQTTTRGLPGLKILRRGAKASVSKPSWGHTHTVFRPFPARNPDNSQEYDPFRLSEELRDIGDWMRSYTMVTLGDPGVTFILFDPRERGMDAQQGPATRLYDVVNRAVASRQAPDHWWSLVMKAEGESRRLPIQKPKPYYLMQGILLMQKGRMFNPPVGSDPDGDTCVMWMSSSAGESIYELAGEGCDDFCALEAGKYLDICQTGTPALVQSGQAQQGPTGMPIGRPMTQGQGGRNADISYSVTLMDTFNGWPPRLADAPNVAKLIRPWDDILWIPTVEEQIDMIVNCGIQDDVIAFALGDVYGDMLPERILRARPSRLQGAQVAGVAMPFGGQQAQPVAQPPQQAGGPFGGQQPQIATQPQPDTLAGPFGGPGAAPSSPMPQQPTVQPQQEYAQPQQAAATMMPFGGSPGAGSATVPDVTAQMLPQMPEVQPGQQVTAPQVQPQDGTQAAPFGDAQRQAAVVAALERVRQTPRR